MLKYVIPGIILGAMTGLNPVWHYTAKENLNNYSIISIISKIIGLSLIIFCKRAKSWMDCFDYPVISEFFFMYISINFVHSIFMGYADSKRNERKFSFFYPSFPFFIFFLISFKRIDVYTKFIRRPSKYCLL